MAYMFGCDICGKCRTDKPTKQKWFTLGVEVIPTLTKKVSPKKGPHITIWQWPTGCRLQQPHDALYHVCSIKHAMQKVEQILNGETNGRP